MEVVGTEAWYLIVVGSVRLAGWRLLSEGRVMRVAFACVLLFAFVTASSVVAMSMGGIVVGVRWGSRIIPRVQRQITSGFKNTIDSMTFTFTSLGLAPNLPPGSILIYCRSGTGENGRGSFGVVMQQLSNRDEYATDFASTNVFGTHV